MQLDIFFYINLSIRWKFSTYEVTL